jgi:hypothetical protein
MKCEHDSLNGSMSLHDVEQLVQQHAWRVDRWCTWDECMDELSNHMDQRCKMATQLLRVRRQRAAYMTAVG